MLLYSILLPNCTIRTNVNMKKHFEFFFVIYYSGTKKKADITRRWEQKVSPCVRDRE